ncbi:hypothetical protein M758_6G042800 [Ceratodon purpureus]|nr:hypothetical protein M758_6G042800 [Ceratodon purpureus]KAG0612633.1 hypothetical protein M758_6G042800 [Ceratodon purpureus]
MAPKRKAPAAATTEEDEGIPEVKKRGDRAEAAAASAPLESEHEDAGPSHEKGSPAEKKGTEKEEDGEEEGSEDEQMTASKGETAAEKASEEAGSGAEDEVEKATPSTKSPGKRTTTPGKDEELEEEDENEAEEETAAPEVEIPAKKKGTATRSAKKETVKVDNADEDLDEEMERAPNPDVKPAGATNGVNKSVERCLEHMAATRGLIVIQEGASHIGKLRAPKTAAQVLSFIGRNGHIYDENEVGLIGSDSLEAGNYTFKQIDVPSIPSADGGRTSIRQRLTDNPRLQSFVQSASRYYRQWEQAEKAVQEAGVEEGHKNFLVVSSDPFGNYPNGFLLWVRKCYKDLKEILAKAEASERFTLLGTAGIGKSIFTIFWICYLATLKVKVVWKFASGTCFLLDFSDAENATVYGPFKEDERELGVVYNDRAAWLIIDGGQRCDLQHTCHILLTCEAKKENYKQFSKDQMVKVLYVPVWASEEIIEFLDDFEVAKDKYPQKMNVPVKEDALGYFAKLGGVPRYVLSARKAEERLFQLQKDIKCLEKDCQMKVLSGKFEEMHIHDSIVHMKCKDGVYDSYYCDFASLYVKEEFGKIFYELDKREVVNFLKFLHLSEMLPC